MRDIKFRAWDKTINYMDDRVRISHFKDSIEVLDSWSTWRELKKDEYEIMQYTGKKDINGVEIYEGDIVKVTDDGDVDFPDGGIGVIGGLEDLYMWYVYGDVDNALFDITQSYEIEVIGNIYENPELLED